MRRCSITGGGGAEAGRRGDTGLGIALGRARIEALRLAKRPSQVIGLALGKTLGVAERTHFAAYYIYIYSNKTILGFPACVANIIECIIRILASPK